MGMLNNAIINKSLEVDVKKPLATKISNQKVNTANLKAKPTTIKTSKETVNDVEKKKENLNSSIKSKKIENVNEKSKLNTKTKPTKISNDKIKLTTLEKYPIKKPILKNANTKKPLVNFPDENGEEDSGSISTDSMSDESSDKDDKSILGQIQ